MCRALYHIAVPSSAVIFSRAQGNQLPLDLGKQAKQRHHHLGLEILLPFQAHPLFDRDQPNAFFHQGIDRGDDFPHRAPHPTSFADDERIACLQTRQQDIELAFPGRPPR